ncbi:MAG TPA: AMP-binding protein, partial [Rhizomicrobium sp.]|nr:AMP-binding protein [Rhizomicrobium sp.]
MATRKPAKKAAKKKVAVKTAAAKKAPTKKAAKKVSKKAAAKPARKAAAGKAVARKAPVSRNASKPGASRRPRKSLLSRAASAVARVVPRITLGANPYNTDLDKNAANYQSLTPLQFLERSAKVFPNRTAIIHGTARYTYAEFYARARRLASALQKRGIKKGDTVA